MYLSFIFVCITILTFTRADESSNKKYDFDLIVIGGGSGGLAAAKAAFGKYNKRVLVLDYVEPSPRGTFWGEGGTCVNVGCIPKKLMHQASLIGKAMKEANKYGWKVDPESIKLNWKTLKREVTDNKKATNFVTRTQLLFKEKKTATEYINGLGEFVNENTIKVTLRDKLNIKNSLLSSEHRIVTAEHILIAVGGRPFYPNIEGLREHAITSDDLFSLEDPPGKTLIVGAGYIGLECAGVLRGLGMDVTVMYRSKILQDMDQEMVKWIEKDLERHGVKFLAKSELVSIVKSNSNSNKEQLHVKWKTTNGNVVTENEDYWDTVLVAAGRRALTDKVKVENANVKVDSNLEIDAKNEQTNVPNIYAVGDVLYGKPHLTPVAIQAARLLMDRLYGGSSEEMDYNNVPTTVFTPLEYSFVGLSTEQVANREDVEIYHSKFNPIEFSMQEKGEEALCYLRVICKKGEDQLILGMHYFGPSAGEVIQGYATAFKAGLTFKQLKQTLVTHQTSSGEFTRVHAIVGTETDPTAKNCCD